MDRLEYWAKKVKKQFGPFISDNILHLKVL